LGNLTADVIATLFPEFDRVLRPHGLAIFSGILHDQIEDLSDCLSRFHFSIYEELTRGEWLALVCQKNVP
jgi:ribosomal protein L11 methylase PrmA